MGSVTIFTIFSEFCKYRKSHDGIGVCIFKNSKGCGSYVECEELWCPFINATSEDPYGFKDNIINYLEKKRYSLIKIENKYDIPNHVEISYMCNNCKCEYTDSFFESLHYIDICKCEIIRNAQKINETKNYEKWSEKMGRQISQSDVNISLIKTDGPNNVILKCKSCNKEYSYNPRAFKIFKDSNFKYFKNKNCCCAYKYENLHGNPNSPLTFPIDFINENGEFKLLSLYEAICKNNHKIRIKKGKKYIKCVMCEYEEKYELFKLLKELNVKYNTKEDFKRNGFIQDKRDMKELKNYVIYTYNDKNHLTGKIVFDDSEGDKQLTAKKNNLVFRWFDDYDKLNDRNYCLVYLEDFFQEIINKNKLNGGI